MINYHKSASRSYASHNLIANFYNSPAIFSIVFSFSLKLDESAFIFRLITYLSSSCNL